MPWSWLANAELHERGLNVRELMCPTPVNEIAFWMSAFDEIPTDKKALTKYKAELKLGRKATNIKNAKE